VRRGRAARRLGCVEEPDVPHVLLPRKRKVPAHLRGTFHLHRRDLLAEEQSGPATSVELTLDQCLRGLPWPDALSVADSALRHDVPPSVLRRLARTARGPGAVPLRRVAAEARREAANPFESSLRAVALDVAGLHVRPQGRVELPDRTIHPDLVDDDLRIVLEADSFLWHGHRSALRDDARHYDELVVAGWLVLRFAWEDVMHDPAWVRSVLERAVALRGGRTEAHLVPTAAARRRDGCTRCGSGPGVRSVRLTAP